MKYIISIILLVFSIALEYFGIAMADELEKMIENKIVSTVIIVLYCCLVFVALVLAQVKFGIFGER